jgi:hypothetical protein
MGAPGGGRLLADLITGKMAESENAFSFQRLDTLDRDALASKRLL